MTASNHAILDLGEDDLQFTTNDYKSTTGNESSSITSFPDPNPQTNRDTDNIIGDESSRGGGPSGGGNFWKMSYYQRFFDVEDKDLLTRLLYSMLPIPGKSFLQHHIRPKPDLYGPFWSCVTLIFSIAISGNIASYLTTSLQGQAKWHYDFHKVSLASTAVFSYTGLVPSCLYGYLWWAGQGGGSLAVSFLELLCLYGYSITIYIPISILWLVCVKIGWLQWVLVLVGASLSGAVLFSTVWPQIRANSAKASGLVMLVVVALHFLLASGFMLYFFHSSTPPVTQSEVVPVQPEVNNNNSLPVSAALKSVQINPHLKPNISDTARKQDDPNSKVDTVKTLVSVNPMKSSNEVATNQQIAVKEADSVESNELETETKVENVESGINSASVVQNTPKSEDNSIESPAQKPKEANKIATSNEQLQIDDEIQNHSAESNEVPTEKSGGQLVMLKNNSGNVNTNETVAEENSAAIGSGLEKESRKSTLAQLPAAADGRKSNETQSSSEEAKSALL